MTSYDNTLDGNGDQIHVPPHLTSRSYAIRKSVAEGFLDIALLLANTSQLRSVLEVPEELRTWTFLPLVIMLGLSLLLQLVTGIILYVMANLESDNEKDERKLKTLNHATVGLIAIITFCNAFIAGFGMKLTEDLSE